MKSMCVKMCKHLGQCEDIRTISSTEMSDDGTHNTFLRRHLLSDAIFIPVMMRYPKLYSLP